MIHREGTDGKLYELVRILGEGCTGCVGSAHNAPVECSTLPSCVLDKDTSWWWVTATPKNIARAVADRMNHETNSTP